MTMPDAIFLTACVLVNAAIVITLIITSNKR